MGEGPQAAVPSQVFQCIDDAAIMMPTPCPAAPCPGPSSTTTTTQAADVVGAAAVPGIDSAASDVAVQETTYEFQPDWSPDAEPSL